MFTVEGQVVIVTGAVGRLGAVVARTFRRNQARIVLVDRERERLQRAYGDAADTQMHLLVGDVDLSTPEGAAAVATQTLERFGRIDTLVNTVGAFRGAKSILDDEWATWRFLIEANVQTTFNMSKAVLATMLRQRRGRIINVASRAALAGVDGLSAYSASKAAVVRLTESLSAEVRRLGINVNCVLPGTLDTPENRAAMPDADRSGWVALDALADAILLLATDASRAIHGAAIAI